MSSLKHFTLENELNENKDNIIGKFSDYVKKKLPNNNISLKNISNYIKVTIEIVEKSKFENSNKMKLVLLVLRKLIDDIPELPEYDDKYILNKMINEKTLENLIEVILLASKNKLKLNKNKKSSFICL